MQPPLYNLKAATLPTISANSYSNILFQGSCTKSETNLDKNTSQNYVHSNLRYAKPKPKCAQPQPHFYLSSTKFNGIAYSGKS